MPPELLELHQQGIRQENVAGPSVLGDLGPEPEPILRLAFWRVDIAEVQTYNLGKPQTRPQGQGIDQVVPEVAVRGEQDRLLFAMCQCWRAEVGHGLPSRRQFMLGWGGKSRRITNEDDGDGARCAWPRRRLLRRGSEGTRRGRYCTGVYPSWL